MKPWMKILCASLLSASVLAPDSLWACAACYGQSDSPMAKGMNWGIFSLLAIVATVLGCIATFFVYLGKKSSAMDTSAPANASKAPAEKE